MELKEKIELGVQKYLNLEGNVIDIAKELKIKSNLITSRLNELGYILRGGASAQQVINLKNAVDEFIARKDENINVGYFAKKYNCARATLSKRLKSMGYEIINYQTQTKFNEHIFDSIDTEEKAYWLGFIFADGYIDSSPLDSNKKPTYNFELSLKGDDSHHLEKFNKFIEHQKNIVRISDVKCEDVICKRCRLGVANKHLWETLNSYGCTPKKSLTLKFPNESIFKDKSLIRHFIRGYWDGDGCLSWSNKEHTSPSVSVVGTKEFLYKVLNK